MKRLAFVITGFIAIGGNKAWATDLESRVVEKSGVFSRELVCFDELVEISIGDGFRLKPQRLVILDHKDNRRGFYIFAPQTSYFCQLPAKPQKSDEKSDFYFLKFKLPLDQVKYLHFTDFRGHPDASTFSWSENPEKTSNVPYRTIDCRSYLTQESRSTIGRVLRERISTVMTRLDRDRNDPKENFPADGRLEARYFSALKKCVDVDGKVGEDARSVLAVIYKQRALSSPAKRQNPTRP